MLVLSRKPQQQIQIGSNIVVTILEVSGDRVRVGIEAPREIRIMRSEVVRVAEEPLPEPNESAGLEVSSMLGMHEGPSAEKFEPFSVLTAPPKRSLSATSRQPGLAPLARHQAPSALNSAPQIRPPQRLGPTSLRSLAGRRR